MLVVTDTSPINYLVLIEQTDLLPRIYSRVLMPIAVQRELQDRGAPDQTRSWATNPPEWVQVVDTDDLPYAAEEGWEQPGAGERAALTLARVHQPCILLVDEYAARTLAQRNGLLVTGTLGVLDEAARRGYISFPEAIRRLQRTSFRYPRTLVERLLREDELRAK